MNSPRFKETMGLIQGHSKQVGRLHPWTTLNPIAFPWALSGLEKQDLNLGLIKSEYFPLKEKECVDAPRNPQVSDCHWSQARQAGSLAPGSTSQHSDTCGVYPSLILQWCAHWWAAERIQNVFGAVSYYVLKNNRLHAVALFLSPFLSFKATGELKIPISFQGPHHIRVTINRRLPLAPEPLFTLKSSLSTSWEPSWPGASWRMPSRAPLCRRRQRAAHCGGVRGCTPGPQPACSLGHQVRVYYSRW